MILQAAVFGVPNDLMGELVYAAVRLNPGAIAGRDVSATELVHLCRQHLSAYKV
jgi:acyl-coenzyme A synthetase/AMP-(fatty) acid ligase